MKKPRMYLKVIDGQDEALAAIAHVERHVFAGTGEPHWQPHPWIDTPVYGIRGAQPVAEVLIDFEGEPTWVNMPGKKGAD